MIFQQTSLPGAYIIELETFRDERGLFARTYCQREFETIGHHREFVQFNHSRTKETGTVRGMHFQHPPHAEIKLIRCIRGRVYDVIVDLRKGSPTFLKHIGLELSEENMRMIYVPEGFAHGFQTLEDNTELIYHHTAFYAPRSEGGFSFNDPTVGINWPLPATVVSDKDRNQEALGPSFAGIALQPTSKDR